ncbi:type II toxin-antitoxin system RelE/ParE family toxin [Asticcacaulis sp. AC402]|uniref:type II toxin-antitoxin system RelE/ParE family toxin n=1 Tax=Asticcacaulis sp. AC402 TaxID=1282361 RepID=UPI0003C3BD05|nr:type II toxin-antitoxin system RelE/ParE family toxin [Asticcacaulis sp. AC402]ESQ76657.1 hypothetical protein ABAC402_02990 [Asticcacaulis sp. AC402]
MPEPELAFQVAFFATPNGNKPAWEFLKLLDKEDRSRVGFDLKRVQIGFPVGMPLCRPFGDGLYELRCSLPSKREARLLFFVFEDTLIIVSGFIKKTQKTPEQELQKARERKKEFLSNTSKE